MADFVGRAELLALVEGLVKAPAEPDEVRPILVVHGHGGSGRTELLRRIRDRWAGHTPIAWVAGSRLAGPCPEAPRPLLSALMLDLIARVPRYEPISFDRVTLAHIAMRDPIRTEDQSVAIAEMRQRISEYRPSTTLALLRSVLVPGARAAAMSNAPAGAADAAGQVAENAARMLVDRLERSGLRRRLTFGNALRWFAGQNPAEHAGERALLHLGWNVAAQRAAAEHPEHSNAARDEVEDLLVRAFLADIAASTTAMPQRPVNPILLLDDADRPDVVAFLTALVRIRRDAGASADPLTVIATGSGQLPAALRAVNRVERPTDGACAVRDVTPLADDGVPGQWVSVPLGPLTADDTHRLAARPGGTAPWASSVVGDAVHRIAAGHPAATRVLLRALRREQQVGLVGRLHSVLTGPAADGPGTVADSLLEQMVSGLHSDAAAARETLVTLSAARTVAEAEALVGRSGDAAASDVQLLDLATQWADPPRRTWPQPPHFLRYLLLRRLAARSAEHPASWTAIHAELRDRAGGDSADRAAQLHHQLALGELTEVGVALQALQATVPGEEWLAILDDVTAVPDLRRELDRHVDPPLTLPERVAGLVRDWQLVRDPRCDDPQLLGSCLLRVARDYEHLSGYAASGVRTFLNRADLARRKARALT